MFKLVLLSATIAIVMADPKPGLLAPVAVAHTVPLVPAAVSHQSRIDIPSKPIIATYAAPIAYAQHGYVAPHTYAAPLTVGHIPTGYSAYSTSVINPGVVASPHLAYAGVHGAYGLHHY